MSNNFFGLGFYLILISIIAEVTAYLDLNCLDFLLKLIIFYYFIYQYIVVCILA